MNAPAPELGHWPWSRTTDVSSWADRLATLQRQHAAMRSRSVQWSGTFLRAVDKLLIVQRLLCKGAAHRSSDTSPSTGSRPTPPTLCADRAICAVIVGAHEQHTAVLDGYGGSTYCAACINSELSHVSCVTVARPRSRHCDSGSAVKAATLLAAYASTAQDVYLIGGFKSEGRRARRLQLSPTVVLHRRLLSRLSKRAA